MTKAVMRPDLQCLSNQERATPRDYSLEIDHSWVIGCCGHSSFISANGASIAMSNCDISPNVQTPCRHLRNKEMYYQGSGQEDDEFASGIHWCAKTQEAFGPDGQEAGKTQCCAERACYVD